MIKTRYWISGIAVLLLISIAASLLLSFSKTGGTVANVYIDGTSVYSVDLSALTGNVEYNFDSRGVTGTLCFDSDGVYVAYSTCRDQTCVKTGRISDSAKPIVCLPARLVVKVERDNASGIDAVIE